MDGPKHNPKKRWAVLGSPLQPVVLPEHGPFNQNRPGEIGKILP